MRTHSFRRYCCLASVAAVWYIARTVDGSLRKSERAKSDDDGVAFAQGKTRNTPGRNIQRCWRGCFLLLCPRGRIARSLCRRRRRRPRSRAGARLAWRLHGCSADRGGRAGAGHLAAAGDGRCRWLLPVLRIKRRRQEERIKLTECHAAWRVWCGEVEEKPGATTPVGRHLLMSAPPTSPSSVFARPYPRAPLCSQP